MKYSFLTLTLLFLYNIATAQVSANINPAAKLSVTNATGSNPYTLTVNVSDDLSRFTFNDFGVGDSVYLIDGSDLLIYVVNSKLTSPNRLVVSDVNNTGIFPSTGQGAIIKPTANGNFTTYISGLRDDLRSMIMNRLSQQLGNKISIATEIYKYTGTTGVLPAVTASQARATVAQNMAGQLSYWTPLNDLTVGNWYFPVTTPDTLKTTTSVASYHQAFQLSDIVSRNNFFLKKNTFSDSTITNGLTANSKLNEPAVFIRGVLAIRDTVIVSDYQADFNFSSIIVNTSTSDIKVKMPPASQSENWIYYIRKNNDNLGKVIIEDFNNQFLFEARNEMSLTIKNQNQQWKISASF